MNDELNRFAAAAKAWEVKKVEENSRKESHDEYVNWFQAQVKIARQANTEISTR